MVDARALRVEGNALYRRANPDLGLCSSVVLSRLQQAAEKYRQALRAGPSDEERAKVLKNLALTIGRIRELSHHSLQLGLACDVLRHFLDAVDAGSSCMPSDWLENCSEKAEDLCYAVLEGRETDNLAATLSRAERLRASLGGGRSELHGSMLYMIADRLFKTAAVLCSGQDYRSTARVVAEARRPLEEAKACAIRCRSSSLQEEVQELEESFFLQQCTCQSVQERQQGQELLRRAMLDVETPDWDAVWNAADRFKHAVVLTREVDVENEAIALSLLGTVFDTALKDCIDDARVRARAYYLKCMYLANSLSPRTFYGEEWFVNCSQALQRYQREAVQRDEAAYNAEREPYLQELASELADLRSKSLAAHTLLKHIYAAHPPSNAEHTLGEEPNASNTKALLKKAILHYHPDRAVQQGWTRRVVILHEEIVKVLTAKYEHFKC